jgi:AcrR family transcriptional regulator
MARNDWLIGGDRRGEAAERIYSAATDLVSRTGFENFSIDALAAVVHCAPATIYRNAGGKKAILEAVTMRMSARIVEAVRTAMENL